MITHILKQHLDKQDFPVVVRALRQNKTIWQALQQGTLLENLVNHSKASGLLRWTPSSIALTELGLTHLMEKSGAGFPKLDDDTLSLAAEALEALLSNRQNPTHTEDLQQAGLAALAIRERWAILDKMEESFFNFIHHCTPIWELTISILLGLVPNKTQFMECLAHSAKKSDNQFAIHALLSQPIPVEKIAQTFTPILVDQPVLKRSASLRMVNQKSPALAQQIATQLLDIIENEQSESTDPFEQLISYIERTELLKLSGQYNQVIPELEHIWKTTTRMQADMTAQLAQAAARGNDQTTALLAIDKVSELEKMFQLEENETQSALQRAAATGERAIFGQKSSPEQLETPTNPTNLLANVKIAMQNGEMQKAQQVSHQVYDLTHKLIDQQHPYLLQSSAVITPDFLHTFLETLLELNLVIEAANIGKIAQQALPNDPEIVWLFAQALAEIGSMDEAVEHTDIALALAPENHAIHRYLISLLTRQENWNEARKEAETLQAQTTLLPEDYTTLANCYLHTRQLKEAVQTCEKGLAQHPNNWQIHQLLGEIFQENRKFSAAQKHFSQAILEKPQMVSSWIRLAKLHEETNEPQKALEKLQSAAEVIPNHPEIYLNIGKLQLAAQREIKALAAFSQAARFINAETPTPVKREIGMLLGQTLLEAGYVNEAITAYEKIHKENPTDETIAYGYGSALSRAQRYEDAFKALTIAVQAPSPTNTAYLDYAELILTLEKNPERAAEFIQRVLNQEPENEKAKILLARATAAAGDHKTAIQKYQEAFNTTLSQQAEYFTLLVTGIADSSFATGQPEVAITFLQEALRKYPDNLQLKQKLCQAFQQANLNPDAIAMLVDIRNTAEPSLENLLWMADQAIALDNLNLAVEILEEANQIAPQMADVIIRLGYVQLENNQEQKARKTFSQLFSAENVDIADLKMAAHALIGLGDISSSIPFIEKALEICDYQSSDLLSELTKLHLSSEDLPSALDTINKHLELESTNAALWETKAEILLKLDRKKAALEALNAAIQISPNNAILRIKAAHLNQQDSNLAAALSHIQKAAETAPQDPEIALLSAQLHKACLLNEEALEILNASPDQPDTIPWLMLKAELLVSLNPFNHLTTLAEISAAILKQETTHPTGLALQALIDGLEGNTKQTADLLEQAIASTSDNSDSFSMLTATAQILRRWDLAQHFAQELINFAPNVPGGHLALAQVYTRQAEHQLACQATQTITHAPGQSALGTDAQQAFQTAIQQARQRLPETGNHQRIQKWENRGNYALLSQTPAEESTVQSAEELAAWIAAFRRSGEKLTFPPDSDAFLDADVVKFQLSLYYAQSQIQNAESMAEEIIHTEPANPIYLANHAFIAHQAGNPGAAYQSIQTALTDWADEPRWHAFAASLEIEQGHPTNAVAHLEQATALEADNPTHYYQLGQAYLLNGIPGSAVRTLQEAVSRSPLEVDYWIALCKAHQGVGDYQNALDSIEKAISFSPNRADALLLAAEVSFEQGSQKKGNQYLADVQKLEITNDADLIQLTNVMVNQGQEEKALTLLDQLIERAFSPVLLLLQKAEIIGETKGVKEKLTLLVTLARDNPKNPHVLSSLAFAYMDVKMPEEAIRAAQYALKNAADGLSTLDQSRLRYLLGSLYQKNGQLDQSLDQLTKCIQLNPSFVEAYLEIGETLRQRREHNKALEYFEKATELAPQDPRGYLKAGMLLKDGKDYPGAEAFLRKAASLDPKDIAIQRQLATVVALAIIHRTERV